jgi:hypothetical protein
MAVQADDIAPVALRAPLFESLVGGFDDDQRHVVMDLGPARAGMVDRLTQWRCRLDIVNLPEGLGELQAMEDPGEVEQAFRRLLPPMKDDRIEVVFCWNLLNYLRPDLITLLMNVVTERLAPGGRVHALIEYQATRMPGSPGTITPGEGNTLEVQPSDAPPIKAPRYTYGALEKLMPGLKSERAMLLGNGMQEYLFKNTLKDQGIDTGQ